uniref:Uncharacterized protein n=1 Tax=Rhizophora mucronata TaxID=61149 RepID=A0A2P2N4J7_RHIMU
MCKSRYMGTGDMLDGPRSPISGVHC